MKHITFLNRFLFEYLILVAVIASMVAILLHERKRLREIETETVKIRSVRLDINNAHRRITGLGSVVAWKEADYRDYRRHRYIIIESWMKSDSTVEFPFDVAYGDIKSVSLFSQFTEQRTPLSILSFARLLPTRNFYMVEPVSFATICRRT